MLFEIFDILEFSDSEKNAALESFKKKLANELLKSIQGELPKDQQEWVKQQTPNSGANDQKALEIKDLIKNRYPEKELFAKSRPVFKRLLEDYAKFMSQDLSQEKTGQLKDLVEKF